ncbi:MAG: histidinol-phosphate transaminase [Nitrospiraceae bacterium]|nr:histidinol-phosphate transaminase [Nitrospiraceae bacterium]
MKRKIKKIERKEFSGIKGLVKPNVLALKAYDAKGAPCRVKLDANESPYPEPLNARFFRSVKTNRYPDPLAEDLRKAFANRMLPAKLRDIGRVLHGNGSDELIYNLICAFGGPVVYPSPTFTMYGKIAQALGEKDIAVPLGTDFEIDDEQVIKTFKKEKAKICFISRPNNPTGNSFSEKKVLNIIENVKGIVVVDEAYQPFSGKRSFLSRLDKYENLAVLMTLSKVGLAALRVGFLIASPELINEVNKTRLPFNVNSFSQAIAVRALEGKGLEEGIKKIVSERDRVFRELRKITGITAYPSDANFILFGAPDGGKEKIYRGTIRDGVLLRNLGSPSDGYLRVTIGTRKENDAFLRAIKKYGPLGGE